MDSPPTLSIPTSDLSAMVQILILDSHTRSSMKTKDSSVSGYISEIRTHILGCRCHQSALVGHHTLSSGRSQLTFCVVDPAESSISRDHASNSDICSLTSYVVHATEEYISLRLCTKGRRCVLTRYVIHPTKRCMTRHLTSDLKRRRLTPCIMDSTRRIRD